MQCSFPGLGEPLLTLSPLPPSHACSPSHRWSDSTHTSSILNHMSFQMQPFLYFFWVCDSLTVFLKGDLELSYICSIRKCHVCLNHTVEMFYLIPFFFLGLKLLLLDPIPPVFFELTEMSCSVEDLQRSWVKCVFVM